MESPFSFHPKHTMSLQFQLYFFRKSILIILTLLLSIPLLAGAEGFKFKIKNTAKTNVAVYYKIMKKSGNFKVKALFNLKPGEERIKEVSVNKGDTLTFYGQNAEDENSVMVKRDFEFLEQNKETVNYIPIIVPEKQVTQFESIEGLSVKLEHNKVLNFLLKIDSNSMSSLSMLENNFQNIYPLGTFIFVDTKTNRILLPPLEPSFWADSENYLTIQDSLYAMVDDNKQGLANAQVAYFVAKMFDSLRVNNTAELEFKAKLSLIRWKPSANADLYQVFNDKAVQDFLQNCYAQIDDPDKEYLRYRLYFLSSYERIDDLEIYGKQYYNFSNQADLSLSAPAQVFSTNLGVMYTKQKTLSNYYSVQNAVLRTKAFDLTSLLFNSFKNNTKNKIIAEAYADKHNITAAIIDEYKSLIAYNPDPVRLNLQALDAKDPVTSILPIQTTVNNLSPYSMQPPDTSKQPSAVTNNLKLDAYNNKVKFYNAHLREITSLFKQLAQTDNDIAKISATNPDKSFSSTSTSPGLLNEIEVNSRIVRKE
jgi:hypothetical protein